MSIHVLFTFSIINIIAVYLLSLNMYFLSPLNSFIHALFYTFSFSSQFSLNHVLHQAMIFCFVFLSLSTFNSVFLCNAICLLCEIIGGVDR